MAAAIVVVTLTACAAKSAGVRGAADQPCAPGPVDNYMAARWQQCWFDSARGRWRTTNHEFHYDVLVVQVEATTVEDAEEITRRWVGQHRERFQEILVYVRLTSGTPSTTRRVRWTTGTGYQTLDFGTAAEP
jgi:hypothetical protein